MNKIKRGFASDNNAGVHPEVLKAIEAVNSGHVIGYGDDIYTAKAKEILKKHFGEKIDPYFVFTGTGANVLGLNTITESFQAIICTETAHINVDECGAPEKFTGCKLLPIKTRDGKLTIDLIKKHLHGIGFEHHVQPRVISLTQATELGTVYRPEEIKQIADFAHDSGLILHMDGARLCNAAVSLNCELRDMTTACGVDILSFGLTKNGGMLSEAVIFFDPELSLNFKYIRKQGMQLGSKMRFVAAQFISLLGSDLWRNNASHANEMAKLMAGKLTKIPGVTITQKVESNGIFALIPAEIIDDLQKKFFFYIWDENRSEVRWMTSYDTTRNDVEEFVELIRSKL